MDEKFLDFNSYWEDDDRIDIVIFSISGKQLYVFDILPSVTIANGFLSVQKRGRYAHAFYFPNETYTHFSIGASEGANKWIKDKDVKSREVWD